MLIDIFIIGFFILLNGLFTCAELAILSVNKVKLKIRIEDGDKKAKLIKSALDDIDSFLPAFAITYTMVGMFVGTYSGLVFSAPLTGWILGLGNLAEVLSPAALESIVVVIITVFLTYFTIIFGETLPKKIALTYADSIVNFIIKPIVVYAKIIKPFAFVFSASSAFLIRVLRIKDKKDEFATEEEIRMMVDVSGETGNIDDSEMEMINNIFEFDDKTAEEIATHRTDIVSLNINDNYQDMLKVLGEQHSRIPVYEDNIDNIIGVLYIRDLVRHIIANPLKEIDIRPILRKPYFVPSSKKLNRLFDEMKTNKIQLSIIIDEYGGTLGLITMEDLIEEIMGSIFDEYDEEYPEIEQIHENTYIISGTTHLDEVNEILQIELPVEEYDTIGGFVVGQLGRIPNDDEQVQVEYNNTVFIVKGVSEKRIQKLEVHKKDEDEGNEE